jgi:hypothetical protein
MCSLLVNLTLVVSAVVNLAYVGYDAPWAVALGAIVTTGLGLAALIRIWQVFPFDFTTVRTRAEFQGPGFGRFTDLYEPRMAASYRRHGIAAPRPSAWLARALPPV